MLLLDNLYPFREQLRKRSEILRQDLEKKQQELSAVTELLSGVERLYSVTHAESSLAPLFQATLPNSQPLLSVSNPPSCQCGQAVTLEAKAGETGSPKAVTGVSVVITKNPVVSAAVKNHPPNLSDAIRRSLKGITNEVTIGRIRELLQHDWPALTPFAGLSTLLLEMSRRGELVRRGSYRNPTYQVVRKD